MVETKTVTDAEGVSIPMKTRSEPYQGAPSTASTTMAVAAAVDTSVPGLHEAQMTESPSESSRPALLRTISGGRTRDKRVHSISGAAQPHPTSATGSDREAQRWDGALHPSVLSARREVGQRAASAATSSSPLRTHSAVDVSRLGIGSEGDTDEESMRWEGSVCNSWHENMAGEQMSSRRWRAPSQEQRSSSALGLEQRCTLAQFRSLAVDNDSSLSSPSDDPSSIPLVHVQDVSSETVKPAPPNKGTSRRRPPAPPGSATLRSRKESRNMLSSSSDPSLRRPGTGEQEQGEHEGSTLGPPGEQSSTPLESREASPSTSPLPGEARSTSASIIRRRRPPPPPIDRSLKGPRRPAMTARSSEDLRQRAHDAAPEDAECRRARQPSARTGEATRHHDDPQRAAYLDQYLGHLRMSTESPYGWS